MQAAAELTAGIGPDRVIDAVGVDAEPPASGEGAGAPGEAPAQALQWEIEAVAMVGTIGIIGVYPPGAETFPIGLARNRT